MKDIENKLYDITEKYKLPSKHSNFQIENFIVGKEVDNNGKIWQCIRELSARKESLDALSLELQDVSDNIELNKIKIQKLELKNKKESNVEIKQLKEKEKQIKIKKLKRNEIVLNNTDKKLNEKKLSILAETDIFIKLLEDLVNKYGYKEFDDTEAQIGYWNNKFGYELEINASLGYNLNPDLLKSIMALPKNSSIRISLENTIKERQKILLKKNN
jgi:hypothetical protein